MKYLKKFESIFGPDEPKKNKSKGMGCENEIIG